MPDTVLKPSTVQNEAGAYGYKSGASSSAQNYIDNEFPNLLDKNNGDTVTGSINIAGGANINVLAGSEIVLQSGAILLTDSGSTADFIGQFVMEGAATLTSTMTVFSTGAIVLDSGADIEWKSGSTLQTDTGSVITLNGLINIGNNVNFISTQTAPTISQADTSSGSGTSLTIQAQTTTQSGQSGGDAYFNAGNGSGTGAGGNIFIDGGTGGSAGGGNISLSGGTATSTINMSNSVGTLLQVGQAGLQMGEGTVEIFAGTNTLSPSVYQYNWIKLTSTLLSGNATVVFPAGTGPTVWMISTTNVSFNGHTVSFTYGSVPVINSPINSGNNINFWLAANDDTTAALIGQ